MTNLVDPCEAWGLIEKGIDARARIVRFTSTGLLWLQAFERAVTQAEAEAEFKEAVGDGGEAGAGGVCRGCSYLGRLAAALAHFFIEICL